MNPTGCPDQLRYSVVGGGDVTAMYTCREISFCDLFEGLPFCIIATAPLVGVKSLLASGGPVICN